jgi:hypothetical protein
MAPSSISPELPLGGRFSIASCRICSTDDEDRAAE